MSFLLYISLVFAQTFSTLHSPNDFAKLMERDYVLVDVRTPEEFVQGALPEAVNISVTDLSFPFEIAKLNKEKPVMIYCKGGTRSARAAVAMKALGFDEIHELDGGYMAWQAAQLNR